MPNPNPSYKFSKGNKAQALRKTCSGGGFKTPAIVPLDADKTFRYVFRTLIREKNMAWFREENEEDSACEVFIKKAVRDLASESTPVQAIFTAFNYLEPIPKSELEGTPSQSLSPTEKELLDHIRNLNLTGKLKIADVFNDTACLKVLEENVDEDI